MKRWRFYTPAADALSRELPDVPPILVRILVNRGLTTAEGIQQFLSVAYDEQTHDPYAFRQMQTAVDRVVRAIANNERIVLYGDYDVDGVSALAILWITLHELGCTNCATHIPDRVHEGYGLHEQAIRTCASEGTTLLIACDCGTTNVNEVALARRLGIDVIIVDHHVAPQTLPPATAFLNPVIAEETYPFRKLCSAGVAYKYATALLKAMHYGEGRRSAPLPRGWEKWLLDLVALATVADMVPLLGENRVFVKHGLTVLRKARRVGLRALSDVMETPLDEVTATTIGFQIAPRLNAAGRLAHANAAFSLLTTTDETKAFRLARELHQTNQQRQRLTEDIFQQALQQIPKTQRRLLVVAQGEGWSSGVIGLVAGKLKETFSRPALAIGIEGGAIVGSGRSVPGFDITAALTEAAAYLEKFGGHPMACGFTVRSAHDLPRFLSTVSAVAERSLTGVDLTPEVLIDEELALNACTMSFAETLTQLEPFGVALPEPIFATNDLQILNADRVGRDGKHLRLRTVDSHGHIGRAIGFGLGAFGEQLRAGDHVDCAYRLRTREWNGTREAQCTLVDIRQRS